MFLLELYAYLALVSNITIDYRSLDRRIFFDDILFTLEPLWETEAFGPMFGCAHGLFQLIPQVWKVGSQRQQENNLSPPPSTISEYSRLEAKIDNWQPSTQQYACKKIPKHLLAAARIYQLALLTLLHTSYYGSDTTNPTLLTKVSHLIEKLFQLMRDKSTNLNKYQLLLQLCSGHILSWAHA